MRGVPKDWGPVVRGLLAQQRQQLEQLGARSRTLRQAIVSRDHTGIRSELIELQKQIAALKAHERDTLTVLRAHGFEQPAGHLALRQLAADERIRAMPEVSEEVAALAQSARQTARETGLNRRLITRLAAWNQREVAFLVAPLSEAVGYGARGDRMNGDPRPAVLDRRG